MTKPKKTKTLIITRPRGQSANIAELAIDAGFDCLLLPTSRIERTPIGPEIERVLKALAQAEFDWLVFTSQNAVSSVAAGLADSGAVLPAKTKIATQGEATALAVKNQLGREADFIPSQAISSVFATELAKMDIAGKKILVPQSALSGPDLTRTLTTAGALVSVVSFYTSVPLGPEAGKLDELEAIGTDRLTFVFHSPSAFKFLPLVVPGIEKLLKQARIASIGPVTSRAIEGTGYKVTIESAEQSDSDLIKLLQQLD